MRGSRRYRPASPPLLPNKPSDAELEDISPTAYFACFDQAWDQYTYGNWVTIRLKAADKDKNNPRLIFKAYKRVHGPLGPSTDDYTWIELISRELVKFLRSQHALKGVDGLNQSPPGVDARDLFLRLDILKASAVEPVLEPEDGPAKNESKSDGLGLSLPPPAIPPAPVPSTDAGPDEAPIRPSSPADAVPPPIDTKPPLTVPEQLWLLLNFIESHFKETIEELERLKSDGYMSYKLLWAICAPGDIVESKDPASEYPVGVRVESWNYGNDGNNFTIQGATYAWDGKVFKQDIAPVEIAFFKGLMKIDQVPIRVMTDQVKQQLIERGKIYQKYAGIHHLKYDAFIAISTADRGIIKLPAKGRVMVDADGYSRYNLNTPGGYQPTSWNTFPVRMPIPVYHSPPRKKLRIPHQEYKNDRPLPDEILCLTPPLHKGWSFAAKAWGSILVTNLSEITFDELAFDQLVLKPEYKKMIKALVETHSGSDDRLAKDLVSGKGGGMVMVLHGKPGTGKTLTAEAVSEHLQCPLYVISSGELGTEPSQLEKQLHDILQMTAAWKAVVLIDEADVFLEARNTFDLRRNGLVSIFLRVLEYHTGVLILTTNRIRTFDKAFVSRFSIAIHYPDLDQMSRLLIWKEFLVRASVDVGDMGAPPSTKPSYITHEELVSLAKKSFNGRVIKQIVRGAQALSIADNEPLRMSHLSAVIGITEQFEADWKELEFTENIPGAEARQDVSMYS